MKKGTTKSGFEYEIEESALDDMELLDAIADAQEEDPLAMSKVLKKLLGEKQRKKMYDHLRTEKGTVPIEKVSNEIIEIFTSMGTEGKN